MKPISIAELVSGAQAILTARAKANRELFDSCTAAAQAMWGDVLRILAPQLAEAALDGKREARVCVYGIATAMNNVGAKIEVNDDMNNAVGVVFQALEFAPFAAKQMALDIAEALGE